MYALTVKTDFAAAHALRGYNGKCENLHGHNFAVEVVVKGTKLDACGMLIDFVELKGHLAEVLGQLDHKNLNDLPRFTEENASAENVARAIFEGLSALMPEHVDVSAITVYETPRCGATYFGRGGGE